MPWTPGSFKDKHNYGLSKKQSDVAAKVANDVLARTGDDGTAIREANAVAGRMGNGPRFHGLRQKHVSTYGLSHNTIKQGHKKLGPAS